MTTYSALRAQNLRLKDKRVVVTRAAEQAGGLIAQLEAHGAVAIPLPTIETRPIVPNAALERALADLAAYDWLVFSSSNGVRVFFDQLTACHLALADYQLSLGCVGGKTAAVLAQVGARVAFVPSVFTAEALAAELPGVAERRVLLPQGAQARPTLAEGLRERGAKVDVIAMYETVAAAPSEAALAAVRSGVDVVVFTSPSTFENFLALVEGAEAVLQATRIACIGPVTAAAVRAAGFRVAMVPPEHTVEGLVGALIEVAD